MTAGPRRPINRVDSLASAHLGSRPPRERLFSLPSVRPPSRDYGQTRSHLSNVHRQSNVGALRGHVRPSPVPPRGVSLPKRTQRARSLRSNAHPLRGPSRSTRVPSLARRAQRRLAERRRAQRLDARSRRGGDRLSRVSQVPSRQYEVRRSRSHRRGSDRSTHGLSIWTRGRRLLADRLRQRVAVRQGCKWRDARAPVRRKK